MKKIKPYGSWKSNLTAEVLARKGRKYGHLNIDNGSMYWLEVRAMENGRGVLMRSKASGADIGEDIEEVLPGDISVRTRVHEYGGGDYLVVDGRIFYSSAEDNRVYLYDESLDAGQVKAITPVEVNKESRYADFCIDVLHKNLIAVRETHIDSDVINELISINLESLEVNVIHAGFDFYSFPRLSKKGQRICWTCWNQPDMPWDSSELWLADFHADGSIDAAHRVTGGKGVSIFQPQWGDDGVLHYISDKSGWTNIYSHREGMLNALTPIDRDFATPQWIFGLGTYVINSDGTLYALNFERGEQHLSHIDPSSGHIEPVPLPFKAFSGPLLADDKALYFCASGPADDSAMYRYDIQSKSCQLLSEPSTFPLSSENISVAEPISFNSENNRLCHAFYYPPLNAEFQAPEGSSPPLIVMSHGGPTAFTDNSLNADIQFWTNRGFAVVDVNYGGSTGFGKKYKELLSGEWGVVDVEDCVAAANYLVEKRLVDKDKLLIRGGSAGGYTTLCALTFYDIFAAGMSRYGVADLESLAADSHKFEARYLDKMVGPYPEKKVLYQSRSPIHHTDQLSCPILLLQGSEDKVVPPGQAESMAAALDEKKIPYAYVLFEGEGHGFRQSETIIKALNAELSFYRSILCIDSEESLDSLKIKHLK